MLTGHQKEGWLLFIILCSYILSIKNIVFVYCSIITVYLWSSYLALLLHYPYKHAHLVAMNLLDQTQTPLHYRTNRMEKDLTLTNVKRIAKSIIRIFYSY